MTSEKECRDFRVGTGAWSIRVTIALQEFYLLPLDFLSLFFVRRGRGLSHTPGKEHKRLVVVVVVVVVPTVGSLSINNIVLVVVSTAPIGVLMGGINSSNSSGLSAKYPAKRLHAAESTPSRLA